MEIIPDGQVRPGGQGQGAGGQNQGSDQEDPGPDRGIELFETGFIFALSCS